MDDATPFQPAPIERVIRVEEKTDLLRSRLDRMDEKLDQIIWRLAATPTRTDLIAGLAVVFALFGIVFAGLDWLETRVDRVQTPAKAAAPAPAPIVIQLPPYPAPLRVSPGK